MRAAPSERLRDLECVAWGRGERQRDLFGDAG